jgi:hypothetical protein
MESVNNIIYVCVFYCTYIHSYVVTCVCRQSMLIVSNRHVCNLKIEVLRHAKHVSLEILFQKSEPLTPMRKRIVNVTVI